MSITIRPATEADKDFLITTTIEAEKSGGDIISYCAIFGITEAELRQLLDKILDENIPGQELCIDSFLIAEEDGKYAGALAAWVEGFDGLASGLIKANLLRAYLGTEAMRKAMPLLKLASDLNIEREPGTLQVESGYVTPEFRGRGVFVMLTDAHIKRWKEMGIPFHKVVLLPMASNTVAVNMYLKKLGLSVVKHNTVADPRILTILPGNTRTLLERKID